MAQHTQKAILSTFQDMLEKMPFDKITVSALASQCGISSSTFYYHFQDIYDLLDAWLQTIKKQYLTDIPQELCWQDVVKKFLRDMQRHPELVYHLFNSLSRERLERYIFESGGRVFCSFIRQELGGADVPEKVLHDIAEYNCYAFLGYLLKFLWHQMNLDIDELVEQAGNALNGCIQWVLYSYGAQRQEEHLPPDAESGNPL